MTRLRFLLPLVAAALASCSDEPESLSQQTQATDTKLYADARVMLDEGDYKDAVKAFDEVERQHPYSEWALKAQIMSAYAAYKAGDYDQATSILERFVRMHPGDASAPYAYYLSALCYYEQISDVGRDQKMTEKALQALTEVVKRFPDTEYARDAKLKLDLAYDHLAGKEMQVGRYYLKRDEYLSAINRFKTVVETYQTTSHVPEALHRLVECYLRLGIEQEAQRYAAVLGTNFPASPWYKDSYKLLTGKEAETPKGGWLNWVLP